MLKLNPRLSIIIACSRPTDVLKCLDGLSKQKGQTTFEVIIVGNCPIITETYQRFDLELINCQDLHANIRRNKGIAVSKAKLIGFLDDDTIPDSHWVEQARKLNPTEKLIITGPERPTRTSWKSELAFAVSQNKLTEGLPGHVNQKSKFVSWTEVPFCNCVIPKSIFEEIGYLATDIPWDMDDFEFCNRARRIAQFVNIPKLSVCHDRYPDSITAFIRYKSRLRIRTGEKLVSHPKVYAKIPTVIVTAICPYLLILTSLIIHLITDVSIHIILSAFIGVYLVIILSQIPVGISKIGLRSSILYVAMIAIIHSITIASVNFGIIKRLVIKLRLFRV